MQRHSAEVADRHVFNTCGCLQSVEADGLDEGGVECHMTIDGVGLAVYHAYAVFTLTEAYTQQIAARGDRPLILDCRGHHQSTRYGVVDAYKSDGAQPRA